VFYDVLKKLSAFAIKKRVYIAELRNVDIRAIYDSPLPLW
jgi:hypothetical protein